jgi:hypothetical protein
MRHALALLALGVAGACHAPDPVIEMPRPYQRNGVRVTLVEIAVKNHEAVGIRGTAENVGTDAVKKCTVHLVVLDFHDLLVSDATATRENLAPGEMWHFEAPFSSPYTDEFDSAVIDRVVVTK